MDIYKVKKPLCLKLDNVALRFYAQMQVTRGDHTLTPLAMVWTLELLIHCNNLLGHYTLVENILKSFLKSRFTKSSPLASYCQTPGGFRVMFRPGLMDTQRQRRFVKKLQIHLHFSHTPMSPENLFEKALVLSDYAFTSLWPQVMALAPAVFTDLYAHVNTLRPTFKSMGLALGFGKDTSVFEKIAEQKFLIPPHPNTVKWNWANQGYFTVSEYSIYEFVVITDNDADVHHVHNPIFIDQLEQEQQQQRNRLRA